MWDSVQDSAPHVPDPVSSSLLPQDQVLQKATTQGSSPPAAPAEPSQPTIPTSIPTSNFNNLPDGKIFLDICSGVTRPLSMALLEQGHSVLSFDILLDSSLDLLADGPYEALLRISASGKVGYGAASPACCEYSRLKLRQDDGPKALRSPEHLSGLPNLTPWELQRVQESFTMLSRCGTTPQCDVLAGASGETIPSTYWGILHQYFSMYIWHGYL